MLFLTHVVAPVLCVLKSLHILFNVEGAFSSVSIPGGIGLGKVSVVVM